MATDWRSAYFEQAKADYRLFLKIAKQEDVPLCQKLHYLQMTTEKMSKGFLTQPGGGKYSNTHKAFVDFVNTAAKNKSLRRICHFDQEAEFKAYIRKTCSKAKLVEDLSPEGAPHPNPEYPWEINGRILTPVEHDFPNLKLSDNKMQEMLVFLESCFALIDRESKGE